MIKVEVGVFFPMGIKWPLFGIMHHMSLMIQEKSSNWTDDTTHLALTMERVDRFEVCMTASGKDTNDAKMSLLEMLRSLRPQERVVSFWKLADSCTL